MSVIDAPAATRSAVLHGARIIDAIKAARIEYVLAVPDIVTAAGVLVPITRDPSFRIVRTCKEDECVGIAAALSYAGKRALVLIQHTGMLYATNALRGVAAEYGHPICMMVGLLNHDSDVPALQSKTFGVRAVAPVLDTLGIPHHQINSDADVPSIAPAIDGAYAKSWPVAFLIARPPVAP